MSILRSIYDEIKQILYRELCMWRYYVIALSWLLLMMIFTYTVIVYGAMVVGNSLNSVHWENQSSLISLVVNCGLVFMAVFDYLLTGKSISYKMMTTIFVGIIFAIGIYGHTGIMATHTETNYKCPLNWPNLSLWMHTLYLIILLWLKERSIEGDAEYVEEYK